MAKVVNSQQQVVVEPWWVRIKIVYVGLGLGVFWWILTVILQHYIIEPLGCRDLSSAAVCVDSFGVAGSIAAVLIALLGAYVLVRLLQPRPIIIAAASVVLLWDVGSFLQGLALWETLLWGAALYAVTYSLFSLAVRIRNTVAAVTVTAAVVIIIRLLLFL